jgi:hypothetical protein
MGHALKSVKFLHCHPIPCIPLNHPTTPHFYDMMWKNTQFLLDVRSKIFYTNDSMSIKLMFNGHIGTVNQF